ncbi:MAG: hypothetical protein ACYDHC_00825 [Desulfuromonadaceae bacterium]
MPTLKKQSNSKNWLIGVPEKTARPRWWRLFFWPGAMTRHNVPEHLRSAGMYCPACRKGQPFSDRCAFCGCAFSCYVVMNSDKVSKNKRHSIGTAPPVTTEQGICHGLLAPLNTALVRLGKASLRSRVIALCVTFLLLISLVAGIVQYRSNAQKHYSQNYVLALYVMKSGMNLGEMVCNGTFNDWRGVEPSTVPMAGGIGPQARADLESVNVEANRIMGKLGSPSAEYSQAAQTLQKLYTLYEKTNSMVIDSPGSVSRHKAEIDAARKEFSREIENLKANMPSLLAEELKKAGKKYDLRFMALKN